MGTIYIDSGGAAGNSGSRDQNAALVSGTNATVAGSVVTLDGSPDLSSIVTSGANQDSIRLEQANNANMKIFWITAFDDVAKTVTVSVAPTGVTGSNWKIGGRIIGSEGHDGVNVLRAGDTAVVNTSITQTAGTPWTIRASGDTTSGYVKIRGAAGVRPVITQSAASTNVINFNSKAYTWLQSLDLAQTHATAGVLSACGISTVLYDVKISDSGAGGVVVNAGQSVSVIASEISGVASDAIGGSSQNGVHVIGSYIHDCSGDGIELTGNAPLSFVLNSVIDTCSGRGVYFSSASVAVNGHPTASIIGATIYGCGSSGVEAVDADLRLLLLNSILLDNGNVGTEYNVNWPTQSFQLTNFGAYNCFNADGGLGGGNLSNYTADATDITTAPAFENAAGADFRLTTGSPCVATGFPGQLLGGGTGGLGYLDMGAVQRREFQGGRALVVQGIGTY